jgi:nucleoside 2-deoxyribosyltransferase
MIEFMIKSIYLIGSLRNREIVHLENKLREKGFDPYASWMAAGPQADDYWQEYCNHRGMSYKEALKDYSAQNVFEFDRTHLGRCDGAILVLPAGKSGHIELGYMVGLGKPSFVLFDNVPDRYDVMYNFATDVCFSETELLDSLTTWNDNLREHEVQLKQLYQLGVYS